MNKHLPSIEELKELPSQLLLNTIIHNRKLTQVEREMIENVLKERGVLL